MNGSQVDMSFGNETWDSQGQLQEWNDRLTTVLCFCVLAGCGVFTNSFPIIITLASRLRKNKVNVMVANMSSADFLECLIVLCGQNLYILWRENLPPMGCKLLGFLQFVMGTQVFVFPPFLSLNRYVALFHSHLYDRVFSARRMYMMIGVSWLLSTLVPFLFLMGGQAKFDEDNEHCCIVTQGNLGWSIFYWICIIVLIIGVCDGLVMFCNIKIFRRLHNHSSAQKLDVNVVRQNSEMLLFMIVDMICPVLTHTVYHIIKFAYVDRKILLLRRLFPSMLIFNSAARGVCTLTLLGPYRRQCKRIFRRVKVWRSDKIGPQTAHDPGQQWAVAPRTNAKGLQMVDGVSCAKNSRLRSPVKVEG